MCTSYFYAIYQDSIGRLNSGENIAFMRRLNDSKITFNRLKDVRSYEDYFMNRLDKVVSYQKKSINAIPENHFMKKMLEKGTNLYYQTQIKYYNPKRKAMQDYIPITTFDPILSYKYYYLRELFQIMNMSQIVNGELREDRRLWHVFSRASEDLHKSLESKLSQFEQISHSIKYQVKQCLVHMSTCQSHDGIHYVYGNIFALVKLGFYTTVWYNFTECSPYLCSNDLVPAEFLDLFFKDEAHVPGYSKLVIKEGFEDITALLEEAFEDSPFKEMLDSKRKWEKSEEYPFSEDWGRMPDDDKTIPGIEDKKTIQNSKWLQSISFGVLICFCVTVGVLPNMGG